jgi:hypothetical protein
MLTERFDHAMQVAVDDPMLKIITGLAERDACRLVVMPHVGAEAFAAQVFGLTAQWLIVAGYADRVRLVSVTAREHSANAAIAFGPEHAIAAE